MVTGAPRGWTEISMASRSDASCRYDVVVIGAGPGHVREIWFRQATLH